MAYPNRVQRRRAVLKMGDGAEPENFTLICGIQTSGITAQTNTSDDFLADCADPEKIPVRFVIPTGEQWDLTGDGVVNLDNLSQLVDAKGVTKNYRFEMELGTGQTGTPAVFEGPFMLTNIQIGGSEDNFASINVSFVSDGEVTFQQV